MDRHEEYLAHFLKCQDELRAFIGAVVSDRGARDDVFQETALILWRRFEEYDSTRPFGAWARGVATFVALKARTRSGRCPVLFSPEIVQAVAEGFDRIPTHDSSSQEALRACLERLPERSRQLLALRYERTLELTEIAASAGEKIETVQKALYRLRQALRECVERHLTLQAKGMG